MPMGFLNRYTDCPKLSFGKANEFSARFDIENKCASMHTRWYGLDMPNNLAPAQLIRTAIHQLLKSKGGIILFCLNDVDIGAAVRGVNSYNQAAENNQITEWELSLIINVL
jgi:hypothetical protein